MSCFPSILFHAVYLPQIHSIAGLSLPSRRVISLYQVQKTTGKDFIILYYA